MTQVNDSRGVLIGSGGVQINLFTCDQAGQQIPMTEGRIGWTL